MQAKSAAKGKARTTKSPLAKKTSSGAKRVIKTKRVAEKRSVIRIQNKTQKTTSRFSLVAVAPLQTTARLKKTKSPLRKTVEVNELTSSPLQLHISPYNLALGFARYGGLFFVVAGAISTVFFANITFSSHALLAEVAMSMDGSGLTTTTSGDESTGTNSTGSNTSGSSGSTGGSTIDCTDPLQYLSASCATVVNKTPTVQFDVNASSALLGDVRVRVKVPHALSVSLSAYNRTQNQQYRIGSMSLISDDTWETYWHTPSFPDGDYMLQALVTNGYGSYQQNDSIRTVLNTPLTTALLPLAATSTQTASSTSGSSGSTVSAPITGAAPTLTFVQNDNRYYSFSVQAANADAVKMYAHQKSINQDLLIGYAYKDSSSVWKYRWDSNAYGADTYLFTAQVQSGGLTSVSNSISVSFNKLQTTPIATSTVMTAPVSAAPDASAMPPIVAPVIRVSAQNAQPFSGIATLKISVETASSVEMYAQKRYSLSRSYLGKAQQADAHAWIYRWDTTQTPNAQYTLIAVVKNQYGTYEGLSDFVSVQNQTADLYTPKQQASIDTLKSVAASTSTAATTAPSEEVLTTDQKQADAALAPFSASLDTDLQRYASALRSQDQNEIAQAKDALDTRKTSILKGNASQQTVSLINDAFQNSITRVENDVTLTNKLIAERTKENASLDSDKDGITDYDEVNIYKTNPFSADTDGDGFTDGAEILGGYDPLDPHSQVAIHYESPKEAGIVRDDILTVASIATAQPLPDAHASATPAALITGKALPNSFVTLYIFSTPVVVTVKTDAEGNWNYRFDKELDNGSHEVYIGMTDNAGNIVAKSKPFSFVKEAEAYTADTASDVSSPQPQAAPKQSLLSDYMIYMVVSISVVAIGLVLILLGIHLDEHKRKHLLQTIETEATV